jgi:hypothetical protein
MKEAFELTVTNIFHLSHGVTVIACEPAVGLAKVGGRTAVLEQNGVVRQRLFVSGERSLLNSKIHTAERALETPDKVLMSPEEAQSKTFKLKFFAQ